MNEFLEQIDISKLRIDLGDKWNQTELEVFLKIFRQQKLAGVGKMQEILQQLGYQRTITNLLSIYKKNKNFLESNQNCTAHDLYLILQDYYQQEEEFDYEQEPIKKIKKNKNCRKSIPQKFDVLENEIDLTYYFRYNQCNQNECIIKGKKISQNFCKWIQHEYFYSHLDYTYFSLNEFRQMLNKANIQLDKKSIQEWRLIKQAIGQPRRFSIYFLQQEMSKLAKYRSVIRNYLFDQNYPVHRDIKNLDLIQDIVRLNSFNIGQIVYAIHPECKHVHAGQILSTNLPNITIKFLQPELGVHKIFDQNIQLEDRFLNKQMSDDRFNMQQQMSLNLQNENKNTLISSIVQELDYFAASFMIRILQRKYALVGFLKQLNQKLVEDPILKNDKEFKTLYEWTFQQINNFDQASKHVMTKFRMRGLNAYQLKQVNNNLDKVLSLPLAYMERELDQNNVKIEEEKKNNEIKQIINKQQDEKINSQLNQQLNSKFQFLENDNQYKPLISSLFGLMFSLNNNSDINMNTNVYWQTLKQNIQDSHPQQFIDIQESIVRIVGNQSK
ncbi:unnamed protein product [Paramecium sonneborni]|uniref:DIRP domain-containing protein n=1 Tax=Paramecium sonneborni TaxID=65129 RepID=A0A8S1QQX4_9CILI|nr:unnamed protein product [Paramecium sonneborni]